MLNIFINDGNFTAYQLLARGSANKALPQYLPAINFAVFYVNPTGTSKSMVLSYLGRSTRGLNQCAAYAFLSSITGFIVSPH
jgi:hypothetical protein